MLFVFGLALFASYIITFSLQENDYVFTFTCCLLWLSIFLLVILSYTSFAEKYYFEVVKYFIIVGLSAKCASDWYDKKQSNSISTFLVPIAFASSLINIPVLEIIIPNVIYQVSFDVKLF